MGISERDIKILWGRSGNRCAICKKELTYSEDATISSILIGEQAHIIAQKENGPRGTSNLSKAERDSYPNLILLCANHHTEIDEIPVSKYSIEKLHQIKQEHELWVREKLSTSESEQRQAEDEVYSNFIDNIVIMLDLINWEVWSSYAVSSSNMALPAFMVDETAFKLRIMVEKAVFSGRYLELENAIITLSHIFLATINIFSEHCTQSKTRYVENQFYKIDEWDDVKYKRLHDKYIAWKKTYQECFYDMAKALNWFADVVRRDINPFFFSKEGRFTIVEGDILGFRPCVYQLDDSEKKAMPQLLLDKISKIDMSSI